MKNKRYSLRIGLLHLLFILFCSGCVSFPVGEKERFTAEYFEPETIKESTTTYEPFVSVNNENDNEIKIGLSASVTQENIKEQQKKSLSIIKQKKISFGLFPHALETRKISTKGQQLYPNTFKRKTKGGYDNLQETPFTWGQFLGYWTLTGTVYGMFISPFVDDYECEHHHYMTGIHEKYNPYGQQYLEEDKGIYLLNKFSESDRKKMGVWFGADNDEHPHNDSFLSGVAHSAWFGFFKYCTFVMEGPVVVETIQHPAEISKKEINVSGPYYVKLKIPGMDFQVIKQVNAGETSVSFDLPVGAEKSSQNGVVSFSKLKLDLMEEGDEKSILEKALEKEFPISLNLPVKNNTPQAALQAKDESAEQPSYKIDELTDDGNGIMIAKVSILTNDNFDGIDNAIRNELSKQYKAKYLNLFNGESKLYVKKQLLNSGKTIIYTLQVK